MALIETILLYALDVVASFVLAWTACCLVIATFTWICDVPPRDSWWHHFKDAFDL